MKLTSIIYNIIINNLTNITILINTQLIVNCYNHKYHKYIEINHHSAILYSVKKSLFINLFAMLSEILAWLSLIILTNHPTL